MNSRERVLNLLQGKPVDRRPFGAMTSLYGARLTGCPLERHYNEATAYVAGQDAVREALEPDFLFGPFLLAGYGEAFGGTLRYSDGYVPNLRHPAISSVEEIGSLAVPDLDTHPRLLFFRESIRRLAEAHGRDAIIVGVVLNPLDLPIVIMGLENWLLTVLTNEAGTRRMLDITTAFFVRLCEKLFADGADILAMPMAFLSKDITVPRLITEFAMPALRQALAQVGGPVVCHHTGSSFFRIVNLVDSLPATAGLALDVRDSIPEARRRIRPETVLLAGLDGPSLHTVPPDEIRRNCLQALAENRDDPRFVPFATGTDVELGTSLEHLLSIRQAVEEFGHG